MIGKRAYGLGTDASSMYKGLWAGRRTWLAPLATHANHRQSKVQPSPQSKSISYLYSERTRTTRLLSDAISGLIFSSDGCGVRSENVSSSGTGCLGSTGRAGCNNCPRRTARARFKLHTSRHVGRRQEGVCSRSHRHNIFHQPAALGGVLLVQHLAHAFMDCVKVSTCIHTQHNREAWQRSSRGQT